MLKLNRTTEYGLMVLRHLRGDHAASTLGPLPNAREIADALGLSFEITAKTLQRLKEAQLIDSVQGARGGYSLKENPSGVHLLDFIRFMEGPTGVVDCAGGAKKTVKSGASCEYQSCCEIKHVMTGLNEKFETFLKTVSVDELTLPKGKFLQRQQKTELEQQAVSVVKPESTPKQPASSQKEAAL